MSGECRTNEEITNLDNNKKYGVLQKFIPLSSSIVGLLMSDVNELVILYYTDRPMKYKNPSFALSAITLFLTLFLAMIEILSRTCKCEPENRTRCFSLFIARFFIVLLNIVNVIIDAV